MIQLQIKSDQQHALPAIQSAIEAKIKRIETGLQRTEEEILKFESKYQISSEHFLSSCTADEFIIQDRPGFPRTPPYFHTGTLAGKGIPACPDFRCA